MRRWRLKSKIVSLLKIVSSRSQSAITSSSSSVFSVAPISPSGFTMHLPPTTGWPSTGPLRIHRRRVVAEHNHLDALQAHHPIGLGPTPVVADAHAHDAAHGA